MKSKPQRSVKSAPTRASADIVRTPSVYQRGEPDEASHSVPRADSALGDALARRILAEEPELVEKLRSGFAAVVIAVPDADMVLPLGDGLRRAVFAGAAATRAAAASATVVGEPAAVAIFATSAAAVIAPQQQRPAARIALAVPAAAARP